MNTDMQFRLPAAFDRVDLVGRKNQSLSEWLIASSAFMRAAYPLAGEFPASEVKARLIRWRKLHRV